MRPSSSATMLNTFGSVTRLVTRLVTTSIEVKIGVNPCCRWRPPNASKQIRAQLGTSDDRACLISELITTAPDAIVRARSEKDRAEHSIFIFSLGATNSLRNPITIAAWTERTPGSCTLNGVYRARMVAMGQKRKSRPEYFMSAFHLIAEEERTSQIVSLVPIADVPAVRRS